MTLTRVRTSLVLVTVIIIASVALLTYVDGPIDRIPRIWASATSPDGTFTVKVYKKRLALLPTNRVGILVRIWNKQGQLVYDRIIFQDNWWYYDIGDMYKNIVFDRDEIRVGPKFTPDDYFVIKKSELKG